MTTATQPGTAGRRTATVRPVVRGALLVTLGAGIVAVVVAAAVSGTAAALGAATGVALVCAYFAGGALVLGLVTGVAPAASVMISLLTYALQVVLAGLVFLVLARSGLLGGVLDARWLAGTVVGGALVWSGAQIATTMRVRVPLYDLPEQAVSARRQVSDERS